MLLTWNLIVWGAYVFLGNPPACLPSGKVMQIGLRLLRAANRHTCQQADVAALTTPLGELGFNPLHIRLAPGSDLTAPRTAVSLPTVNALPFLAAPVLQVFMLLVIAISASVQLLPHTRQYHQTQPDCPRRPADRTRD